MNISLTTPALLFPAISLLLLAYTNRFIALGTLIRSLHSKYQDAKTTEVTQQMKNLRMRMTLIKWMQAIGIMSLLLCVVCMFVLFLGFSRLGEIIFCISLLLMVTSLALSFREVQISIRALNIELSDVEELIHPNN